MRSLQDSEYPAAMQLQVKPENDKKPVELEHKVKLLGAKRDITSSLLPALQRVCYIDGLHASTKWAGHE